MVDEKVEDTLVNKEGRQIGQPQFKGMLRERKSLLVRLMVVFFSDGALSQFSDKEVVQFNRVGVATVHADRTLDLVHPFFAYFLLTLEFLNRVRKAAVLGDEGPTLIAPQNYVLETRFKPVRLFVDSFLADRNNWERYFSLKFITKSNLHLPDIAQACFKVICDEGLEKLHGFILEIAKSLGEEDDCLRSSIWMSRQSLAFDNNQ